MCGGVCGCVCVCVCKRACAGEYACLVLAGPSRVFLICSFICKTLPEARSVHCLALLVAAAYILSLISISRRHPLMVTLCLMSALCVPSLTVSDTLTSPRGSTCRSVCTMCSQPVSNIPLVAATSELLQFAEIQCVCLF